MKLRHIVLITDSEWMNHNWDDWGQLSVGYASHCKEILTMLSEIKSMWNNHSGLIVVTKNQSSWLLKISTPPKMRPGRGSEGQRVRNLKNRGNAFAICDKTAKTECTAPILFVTMIDTSLSFDVDFRGLNTVTEADLYPIISIDVRNSSGKQRNSLN